MTVKDNPSALSSTFEEVPSYVEKRNRLAAAIKDARHEGTGKVSLNKDTSNLFRPKTEGSRDTKIDVRHFNNVLTVDNVNLVAQVEGMTTYEALVDETLKHGCLPTVVPELKTITIGGATTGCGIESSSFKYGLVHETIKEMEILLGDGRIVSCDPNSENSDLFYAFPNTYGTLGYALKVNVQLIPVKPYVKLTHHRYYNTKAYFNAMEEVCQESRQNSAVDYIDGVIFSQNEMYITTAAFTDEAPYTSDYRYMNIYYQSIQSREVDYLTARDYIWRWDPDWFWCSKVFGMQNRLARLLFGKAMLSSEVYGRIMHYFNRHPKIWKTMSAFRHQRESIIQDVAIPIENAMQFYDFLKNNIGITPIWICPTQAYSQNERFDFCPMDPSKLYLDFGFWDSIKTEREEGYHNRQIEHEAAVLEGFKSLYSSSYYTEDEFWQIYDKDRYERIKAKYDPESALRDLYTKCTTH